MSKVELPIAISNGVEDVEALGVPVDAREKAQQMANHSSARTTQLYYRREDEVTVQEIERVRFDRLDVEAGGF